MDLFETIPCTGRKPKSNAALATLLGAVLATPLKRNSDKPDRYVSSIKVNHHTVLQHRLGRKNLKADRD
jgi:hypothetical protein